jgi:hypothetical protein
MLAQSEKVICLHDVAGLLHPQHPNCAGAICKRNDGAFVVEPWLKQLHERVHACVAIERRRKSVQGQLDTT